VKQGATTVTELQKGKTTQGFMGDQERNTREHRGSWKRRMEDLTKLCCFVKLNQPVTLEVGFWHIWVAYNQKLSIITRLQGVFEAIQMLACIPASIMPSESDSTRKCRVQQ
jgi:hypothetical protein